MLIRTAPMRGTIHAKMIDISRRWFGRPRLRQDHWGFKIECTNSASLSGRRVLSTIMPFLTIQKSIDGFLNRQIRRLMWKHDTVPSNFNNFCTFNLVNQVRYFYASVRSEIIFTGRRDRAEARHNKAWVGKYALEHLFDNTMNVENVAYGLDTAKSIKKKTCAGDSNLSQRSQYAESPKTSLDSKNTRNKVRLQDLLGEEKLFIYSANMSRNYTLRLFLDVDHSGLGGTTSTRFPRGFWHLDLVY